MERKCFVIMPFSETETCCEEEWTLIFEALIKPAVEGAGLEYECNRSTATRGNIVGAIMQDLKESWIVIADLTDRNANVFYELGVRHSLKDRTIIISQNRDDISFDLIAYANHVYTWQTEKGKEEFTDNIAKLLKEIDNNPDRPDNPVSDFLGRNPEPPKEINIEVQPEDIPYSQSLSGASSEGLDAIIFTQRLARYNNPASANTVLRLTRAELLPEVRALVSELNTRIVGIMKDEEVLEKGLEFTSQFIPLISKIEQFGLSSILELWQPGIKLIIKIAGDLISISESFLTGHVVRFSQHAPSLLAWQLLMLCGAKSLNEDNFALLRYLLHEPIEVEDSSGHFSNIPFIRRRDLFWPEGMLGNASHGSKYLSLLWEKEEHLKVFYESQDQYNFELAKFYIFMVLVDCQLLICG